ncbi:MAG: VOC family protein [Rhodomicrobium sp.]
MGNSASRFVWYELATNDMEGAKAFYTSVMGWGAGSVPGSNYTQFTAGDTPVAGLLRLPAEASRTGAAPQWIGFAGVDDVDVAAGRVEQLGGTVHVPPANAGNAARFSVIADPQMALLALVTKPKRSLHHSARLGALGHVSWHELHAASWETAFAFYAGLLGWQKAMTQIDSIGTYQQFSAGTEAIGGMLTRSAKAPSLWLYYFNVFNIEAAVKRVEAGGGETLCDAYEVPGGARVVHCLDPQGAIFALIDRHIRVTIGCYSARNPSDRLGGGRTA